MFKKYFLYLSLLWVSVVCISVWIFYTPPSQAMEDYQNLIHLNDQARKDKHKKQSHAHQQTRYQVSKQIFYQQDQQRLQSRLTSQQSELMLQQKEDKTELVEHFKDVTCMMQEEFVKDEMPFKQLVRCLKAREATYGYQSGQFEAEEVELARYLIPGHQWPFSVESFQPFFQGKSQKVEFSFLQDSQFKAQGLQATFHSWEDGAWDW